MPRRRSPSPVQCLGRPSRKLSLLLRRVAEHQRADSEFEACLPADLQGSCHLASQRDGKVLLHADSAAWATRLRYLWPELQERLPSLKCDDNPQVKVRPRQRGATPIPRPPARMSAESADVILECSKHIQDPGLAKALQRLAERANKPR